MSDNRLGQYRIRLMGKALVVVDLHDSGNNGARMAEMSKRLARIGASIIASRVFMVEANRDNLVEEVQHCLEGLLYRDETALVTRAGKDGLEGVIVVVPRGDEEEVRVVD